MIDTGTTAWDQILRCRTKEFAELLIMKTLLNENDSQSSVCFDLVLRQVPVKMSGDLCEASACPTFKQLSLRLCWVQILMVPSLIFSWSSSFTAISNGLFSLVRNSSVTV